MDGGRRSRLQAQFTLLSTRQPGLLENPLRRVGAEPVHARDRQLVEPATRGDRGLVRGGCHGQISLMCSNGSAQAECDLTYSNGAVMRASVTVYSNGSTTWNDRYQENLTAADFQRVLVGLQTISDGDVVSATCYQSTLQKESDGYTQVECVLTLGNASHETTVTYNGVSSPTWP